MTLARKEKERRTIPSILSGRWTALDFRNFTNRRWEIGAVPKVVPHQYRVNENLYREPGSTPHQVEYLCVLHQAGIT